jgi:hypothetical protein
VTAADTGDTAFVTLRDLIGSGQRGGPELDHAVQVATPRDVRAVVGFLGSDDANVRAAALGVLALVVPDPDPELVDTVIRLSADDDASVRDYACFSLGQQWAEVDMPAVRAALVARLEDDDNDTRCEALAGLARRQDQRALPFIREALAGPTPSRLEMEAAGSLGDPSLHALVLDHLDGWDDDGAPGGLAEAVRRLTDPDGPGDDLFAGVADLYRARAAGSEETAGLGWWGLMNAMLELAPRHAARWLAAVEADLTDDPAARHLVETASALATMAATEHA